jgi:NAD(P)-dependent dehydrogenase (short-subunit alcohol dehydrogenase family)
MLRLEGKVALVTGGKIYKGKGANIGAETALRMAKEGARLVVGDPDSEGAEELADRIRAEGGACIAVPIDFHKRETLPAAIAKTVAEYGRLDILSNNGVVIFREDFELLDISDRAFDESLTLNATSYFLLCKAAVAEMIKTGGGSIVNVSSNASMAGDAGRVAYAACKAAINSLTQSIATQYGKAGIRCNAIAPGLVLSPSARDAMDDAGRQLFLRHVLTPYLGKPEHIANLAVFLASDEAAYITGQIICADGGQLAHHPAWADQVSQPVGSLGTQI